MSEKNVEKKGVDSSKIVIDDAGRFELDDEQLNDVAGGMANTKPKAGTVCRIQTSPSGCSMNMP